MIDKVDKLLEYVQKTNPTMTRERLIEELGKCRYSTLGLIIVWENSEKQAT